MKRGSTTIALAVALLLSSDGALSAPPPGTRPSADGEPSIEVEGVLMRMHHHFFIIRAVHRALIVGDLQRARRHARSLERVSAAGEVPAWEGRIARIRSTARRLASARTQPQARALVTTLATQCADCHVDTADVSRFVWSPEPSDDGSAAARMARHQWASEMIWMGLVAPSSERWREGLDALSADPLLPEALSDDRQRYEEIERLSAKLATRAVRARSFQTARARADAFADMMGICADCHVLTRR
jgi:hypothetical protein